MPDAAVGIEGENSKRVGGRKRDPLRVVQLVEGGKLRNPSNERGLEVRDPREERGEEDEEPDRERRRWGPKSDAGDLQSFFLF